MMAIAHLQIVAGGDRVPPAPRTSTDGFKNSEAGHGETA